MVYVILAMIVIFFTAVIVAGFIRWRNQRNLDRVLGGKKLLDRPLASEMDHLAPGVMNWTFRDDSRPDMRDRYHFAE